MMIFHNQLDRLAVQVNFLRRALMMVSFRLYIYRLFWFTSKKI